MAHRLVYTAMLVVFVISTYSQPSLGTLFGPCSSDANCTDVNGVCRQDSLCACNDTTQYHNWITCFEKIPTGDVCNSTAPCIDLQATCQDVRASGSQDFKCACNSGYTDTGGVCVLDAGLERNDHVSESSIGVNVAAVIAPCVVVVIIIVAVVISLRRRQRQTLSDQATLSQIHANNGEVTENYQNTKKSTGITDDMSHEEVMAWMHSNQFISCKKHLKNYTGKDLLALSKDDVARICGAADGIRLFNRMRQRTMNDIGPQRVSEGDLNTHYADLDETTRDRVPYENIEMNEAHMYSSLN